MDDNSIQGQIGSDPEHGLKIVEPGTLLICRYPNCLVEVTSVVDVGVQHTRTHEVYVRGFKAYRSVNGKWYGGVPSSSLYAKKGGTIVHLDTVIWRGSTYPVGLYKAQIIWYHRRDFKEE